MDVREERVLNNADDIALRICDCGVSVAAAVIGDPTVLASIRVYQGCHSLDVVDSLIRTSAPAPTCRRPPRRRPSDDDSPADGRAIVSVSAARLQVADLIRDTHRVVTMADRARLAAAACDCYPVLCREFDALLPTDAGRG